MIRSVMGALSILMLSSTANAQELPRFDVAQHCTKVANFSGTSSEMLRQGCFDMEQAAYDSLKLSWGTLTSSMRSHCVKVATFSLPGSYSLLQGCIQMETGAQEQGKSRQFKY
ncbi:MAG: hypothetical protein JWN71_2988 [Xanthobacteraceae bacterium]|nr:hypothetical protein [Xanthobacteraceae bacterium]